MADEATTEEAQADKAVVRYVGGSDVREIDAAAWKAVGVEDQRMVRWSKDNNWRVPVSELSEGAVDWAVASGEFKLER